MNYDVIVVGGGHAGCEAAHATAVMGLKTLLISSNKKNIADMPCNPSIGGTAKGIVVREIDALGGLMGKVADETHIQIKMLNNAKGPAVRSLRAQADKVTYPRVMLEKLENTPNLTIMEAMVEDLIVNDNTVTGVILENGNTINSKAVIFLPVFFVVYVILSMSSFEFLLISSIAGSKKTLLNSPHIFRYSAFSKF